MATKTDYVNHPSELGPGEINNSVDIGTLRRAIPAHCWKPLQKWAVYYTIRDIAMASTIGILAYTYIPAISNDYVRWSAWILYGYVQGLVMTGIWVLGHECGHSAFSPYEIYNHTAGFFFHSILLTPYFSWRSSHRRHHIYANNLQKDHNYVPVTRQEYLRSFRERVERVEDLVEDSPLYTLGRVIIQQLCGFPWYLMTNITASRGSFAHAEKPKGSLADGHFIPSSSLFRPEEAYLVIASDIGLGATLLALAYASRIVGVQMVLLMYLQPYLWVNHWIVAVTYLHHTHPDVPKYGDEAWSFIKGATATIDRDFGWVGMFVMHNVVEYHVIHHLFPRIPFYYGKEATEAIRHLLGPHYREDRKRSLISALYSTFTQCQFIEPEVTGNPKNRTWQWRGGPSPPIEVRMR